MASSSSIASGSASLQSHPRLPQPSLVTTRYNGLNQSVSLRMTTAPRLRPMPRLRISCAAKPETVDKVCAIVKLQLALSSDSKVTGESKFSSLGADSLDTVEIVMGLEEEFGISVEEESAQNITTVQDAADLIEDLQAKI